MKSIILFSLAWTLLIGLHSVDVAGQESRNLAAENAQSVTVPGADTLFRPVSDPFTIIEDSVPSRYPFVIARPEDRAWLNSLPIEMRPNRPLHFYGNTIRRMDQSGRTSRFPGGRR
jgi:hypothetical protein